MGASVQLIVQDTLRVRPDGFAFDVRLNWYRSLPLSSVEILSVQLDGEPVPLDQIVFEINGHRYSPAELLEQAEELWFVQDYARLSIRQPGQVKAGEAHTLAAEIALRFPYMPIGPGKFLTNVTHASATQVAH
ncbi:MAG: hypothetical protein JNK29_06975 [Anaerolineales bacterium]|nr:hypothetical protein [Anaerolineales bacterium]